MEFKSEETSNWSNDCNYTLDLDNAMRESFSMPKPISESTSKINFKRFEIITLLIKL